MKRSSNAVLCARMCSIVFSCLLWLTPTFAFAQSASDNVPLVLDFSNETLVRTIKPTAVYPTPSSNEKPLARLRVGQTVWSSRRAKGFSLVYDKYSKKSGWIVDEAVQSAGPNEEQAIALDAIIQELDNLLFETNDPLEELKKTADTWKRNKEKLKQFKLHETPFASPECQNLFDAYLNLGEYQNCLREAKNGYQILSEYLGPNDMRTVLAMERLAIGMALVHDEKSSELFAECLQTAENLVGSKSQIFLSLLGNAARYETEALSRVKLWKRTVSIARELRIDGAQMSDYLVACGTAIGNSGQPTSSVAYFEEALKLLEGTENRIQLGGCRLSFGQAQTIIGEYDSAKDNLQHAVDIYRAESNNPFAKDQLSLALINLGRLYSLRRNESAAVAAYSEAIKLESQYSFDARNSLIESLLKLGKVGDANVIARETLNIFSESNDSLTALGYHNLAETMLTVGKIPEAEKLIAKGLKRLESEQDIDHLRNEFRALKASIKIDRGQLDEGLALMQETIDFRVSKMGIENCHYLLHNHADFLKGIGKIEESLELHNAIYEMRRKKYGNSHNCSQASLMALAELYMAQSKFEEAKDSLLVALKAQEGLGRTDFEGL